MYKRQILIRYKRMQGYNALWQPGTDHASIATEVKVIQSLKAVSYTHLDSSIHSGGAWNLLILPEKLRIVSCYQHIVRIEIIQILGLFRPA